MMSEDLPPPPAIRSRDPLPVPAADQQHPGSTGPLAVWLGLQLAVTLVVVLRVPLAAQYPEPAEQMAAYLVTGTQVVAGALLFPFLFRSGHAAVQVIASGWPFLLAAGYLAGAVQKNLLWSAAMVSTWLLALALWAPLLRSFRAQMLGVAIGGLLTLGAGILRYLRLEFGSGGGELAFGVESASPLLSTWAALEGSGISAAWILLGALVLAAVAARLSTHFRRAGAAAAAVSPA